MKSQSVKPWIVRDDLWKEVFRGRGIDVSDVNHGLDPAAWPEIANCEQFTIHSGPLDQLLSARAKESYDFLYSCHYFEYLRSPASVLRQCWSLVKPRGYMAIVVSDEDLYEQGKWPSRFNAAHQSTYTLHKRQGESHAWSPRSINLFQLIVENLPDCRPLLLRVRDAGYDYSIRGLAQTDPPDNAEAYIECVVQKLES